MKTPIYQSQLLVFEPMQKLYKFQVDLISEARQKRQEGNRRFLIQLPTGAGKTVIASKIVRSASSKGKRTLILVHREEIMEQTKKTLAKWGVNSGMIYARSGYSGGLYQVDIGMIQTVTRRLARMQSYDVVIVDEAHHATALTWKKVILFYSQSTIIGLTATPIRNDGTGLGDIFQTMIVGKTTRWLIENNYLSPYNLYSLPEMSQMWDDAEKKGNEIDYKKFIDKHKKQANQIIENTVEQYSKHAAYTQAIYFSFAVENSKDMCRRFNEAGYKAEHIDADIEPAQRQIIIQNYANKKTQILCNVGIITEGFDVPETETIIIGRRTLSLGLYLQMVGRGLRFVKNKTAKIIDLAGNYKIHGLPCDQRDWELEKGLTKRKRKATKWVCSSCGEINEMGVQICEYCKKLKTKQKTKHQSKKVETVRIK